MTCKIAFYKGYKGTWIDKLISYKSYYSHVELIINDVSYSSSFRDKGVRKKTIKFDEDKWSIFNIDNKYVGSIIDFYLKTKGCKYDFLAIFLSQILPLNIHFKNKYFCSEWVAEALELNDTRIDPTQLYFKLLELEIINKESIKNEQ